jgi:type IV pilus assembly protein PilY1
MFNHNDVNAYLQRLRYQYQHGLRVLVRGFCVLTAGVLFFGAMPAHGEVDLADVPMFTQINPPPPNIMILMDDSGSMTYEVLAKGQIEGRFITSSGDNLCYVFGDLGDGYYVSSFFCSSFDSEDRKYWKSQFHEENFLYYNPDVIYEPWPEYLGQSFADADKETPLVHPFKDITLDLDATSLTVDIVAGGAHNVPWAHYFVEVNDTPYLVEMAGVHKYYTFTFSGSGLDEKIVLLTEASPPPGFQKDYETDRQNFANWFTYYRRREFVAKGAIARALRSLEGFRVGILGINREIIVPLKPVNAMIGGVLVDETDTLIEELLNYESNPNGGTPLKRGLEWVGEYYQANDGDLQGQQGNAPYPADDGDCQQSFTIVMTDGYYSDDEYRSVGNTDGANGAPYADWGGGEPPYADGYSHTLADIAMYYYANDLSDFDNKVPINKLDGASHQHMVTFAVAFGVSGTLNPDDYEDDRTSANYMKKLTDGTYVVWPQVTGDRQPQSVDDLWHATVNGRGEFLNAGTPGQLREALTEILRNIGARKGGSGASVAVNGDWLYTRINDNEDILIFQSSYSNEQDEWVGDVKAFGIHPVSGEVDSENPKWSAAAELQDKAWNTRNILTYNGTASGSPFDYDELTPDQKAVLNSEEVDYIKGQEISGFRARSQKLGDIVHSSPVFENDVVYVGANDGMLHAFDVTDGDELFAYVPNLVFENLKDLTEPAYTHNFYVDLTPTVKKGEALLGRGEDQTILVGGLGKGGMGYFALDITKPKAMSAAEVLWEFPRINAPDADMGYSFSKPVVVQSNSTKAGESWIVIFGNGYNSASGKSVLYILDAATGNILNKIVADDGGSENGLSSPIAVDVNFDDKVDFIYAGDLKGNLWKFDLTGDKATDWEVAFEKDPLFSALDPKGNPQPITTKPDVMFHPEMHGYIVCFGTGKFLGGSDFDDISVQTIYGIWDYGDTVFQPWPGIGWSPDDDGEFLGTFRVPNEAAQLSNQPQTVKLLEQVASEVKVGSGEDEVIARVLTDEKPNWETTPDPHPDQLPNPSDLVPPNPSDLIPNDAGWYLDLDFYAKERVISDVILRDGILIVIGFIPETGRCGAGGDSVFMELNAFTGGRLAGINFDIHDDGSVGQDDYVEIDEDGNMIKVPPSGIKLAGHIQPPAIIRLNETTEKKYLSSSGGGIVEITERAAKTGIAYWMELRQ